MIGHKADLTIDSVLADPMIRKAMKADHVDPLDFERLMRTTARRLEGSRPAKALPALFSAPAWGAVPCLGCT